MAKILLQLYPRGFLGEQNGTMSYSASGKPRPVGHKSVDKLYGQYINRALNTTSVDFRRKVLTVALQAFGTRDFEVWYSSQRQSPGLGRTHIDFLEDTLRFIWNGRREMDVNTWLAILELEDAGDRSGAYSELAKDFFGIRSNGVERPARNRDMVDVVQAWCSRAGGIEDMLCTLHVLFGNVTSKTIAMGE